MKIKVIMPDKAMTPEILRCREEMLREAVSESVEISVDCIKKGPDELDCNTDEAFASAEMVKESIRAEKDGYDAIVIYCFSDVAIDAIRENVKIPVIGPGETTLCAASMLCNKFTVITTESINIPRTYRRLRRNCNAREKMISVRALDVPIAELRENPEVTMKYLEKVCKEAIEQEHIDGVVLGCLGMAAYAKKLEESIPIKVFEPAFIAVAYAEMSVRLGLRHVEIAYPKFKNVSNVDL